MFHTCLVLIGSLKGIQNLRVNFFDLKLGSVQLQETNNFLRQKSKRCPPTWDTAGWRVAEDAVRWCCRTMRYWYMCIGWPHAARRAGRSCPRASVSQGAGTWRWRTAGGSWQPLAGRWAQHQRCLRHWNHKTQGGQGADTNKQCYL